MARLTLATALEVINRHDVGSMHRQGHAWVERFFVPAVERVVRSKHPYAPLLAARAFRRLAELRDLNGTPRAAIRAYNKSLAFEPTAEAWHAIGCMLDNMGRYAAARRALMRAQALDRNDELIAGDLERVEWAMLHRCPALYDDESELLQACEALAAGRRQQALKLLSRKRKIRARQIRARVHAASGDVAAAIAEWTAIASTPGRVELQHADWYYTLRGPVADDSALWRIMLWQIRPRLSGGIFQFPLSLMELDVTDAKRFELHARCQLARCQDDRAALWALAEKYPGWREPIEAALGLGR